MTLPPQRGFSGDDSQLVVSNDSLCANSRTFCVIAGKAGIQPQSGGTDFPSERRVRGNPVPPPRMIVFYLGFGLVCVEIRYAKLRWVRVLRLRQAETDRQTKTGSLQALAPWAVTLSNEVKGVHITGGKSIENPAQECSSLESHSQDRQRTLGEGVREAIPSQ